MQLKVVQSELNMVEQRRSQLEVSSNYLNINFTLINTSVFFLIDFLFM